MAIDEITTIKVFKVDRRWLEDVFGQPAAVAFHKVRALCPHPDASRTYTTAVINAREPSEGLDVDAEVRTVSGYRCGACGTYIFPDPRAVE